MRYSLPSPGVSVALHRAVILMARISGNEFVLNLIDAGSGAVESLVRRLGVAVSAPLHIDERAGASR
jgi:hypothetical protein